MSNEIRSIFQEWDVEGSGFILTDQLAEVLRRFGDDLNVNALLSSAQIKPGDKIAYEAFLAWLFCDESAGAAKTCLWEGALTKAVSDASRKLPSTKVDAYFSDVRDKVTGPQFTKYVRGKFYASLPSANFNEVLNVVNATLLCTASTRLSPDQIRSEFDAHVAAAGRGCLEIEEFVNLFRSLQVQVALATLLYGEARAERAVQQMLSQKGSRENGLWESAMVSAREKGQQRFDRAAVDKYFDEVYARLSSAQYAEHVKGALFTKVDSDKDGKVSFQEVLGLIRQTLQCAADVGGSQAPTPEAIQEVFIAHDSDVVGYGFMGSDEFLNLMRYLQVRVAEAMLPLSKGIKGC